MSTTLTTLRVCCVALLFGAAAPAFAQTCASNAIPVSNGGGFVGNTCNSTVQLPALANGAIQSPGPQDIYALHDLSALYLDLTLTLTSSPNSLSLYVCRNPCSTFASCVAVADTDGTGVATIKLPQPAEYFLVVGSAAGTCNTYSLTIFGTFND
jgi:hypothetical protein